MNYFIFNKWVFDYFRSSTLKNGFCSLAIDEYEIEIFKRKYSLKNLYFNEIRFAPWSKLLLTHRYDDEQIPSYFGLIALQCLAASSMEKLDIISAANFSNRFCGIIGIESNKLIGFYSEHIDGVPIQEVIWNRAKNYLSDNLGFYLNIPNNIEGPGRYIQFPKSQVVLNKQDLKEIADKVFRNLNLESSISETLFKKLFYEEFLAQTFYRKNNNSKHEGEMQEIFFKQVYNYYNSGEWDKVVDIKEIPKRSKKIPYFIEFGLKDTIHFFRHMIEVHQLYEIFKGGDVYIFEKVAGSIEFEQSSLFSLNTELVLVSSHPLKLGTDVNHNHLGLHIVRCFFNSKEEIPSFLKGRLRHPKDEVSVYLKGLRLGHSWNYIQNFGPQIIGKNYSILYTDFDNPKEQIIVEEYDSLNCNPGLYRVRIAGFTSLRFVVLNQKDIKRIDEVDCGLKLNSFAIGNDGILLKGLKLCGHSSAVINKRASINSWVKANTNREILPTNTLLKSIKYQYYDQ